MQEVQSQAPEMLQPQATGSRAPEKMQLQETTHLSPAMLHQQLDTNVDEVRAAIKRKAAKYEAEAEKRRMRKVGPGWAGKRRRTSEQTGLEHTTWEDAYWAHME